MLQPSTLGGETRVRSPGWIPQYCQQSLPLCVVAHRECEPALIALTTVSPMRSRTRGTVSLAPQHPAVDLVVEERGREEMERGFVLRQVDVLPNPSATAVVERGHQHRGGKARGDEIGVGTVGRGGLTVRPARDMIVARE